MTRPKGSRNKASAEVRGICKRLVEDEVYTHNLQQRLSMGKAPPAVECMVWHYAYGKPKDTLDVNVHNERRQELEGMTDEQLAEAATSLSKKLIEDGIPEDRPDYHG